MKKIVVLTGAGISAESGINTFRDANGLWEGHDIMEVASPIGWRNDQDLVLDFYNKRRRQLQTVVPNKAHFDLVTLEQQYDVTIITQNVDDLHERAGSSSIIHLHGELLKVRSQFDEQLVLDWKEDLNTGDLCEHNSQLRPHIVWFGEDVPMMDKAIAITEQADFIMIIGTSMQVYPAAGLVQYAPNNTPIYFIDPKPSISANERLTVLSEKATTGVQKVVTELMK
ncbi:NAD-dependent deacylase [Aquimarina sp. AD10]|uniref:SIR2 family NAD-dependent protein deacylase n=1 Tax=Aquimarina sp. AD10 TaxID=1714849 RepID=UPI000E51CD4D|nr:Sir2 family NAD-dependent protein deacetylase [Aquimarina sp. AD10]AXT59030.1 NAD-dependent deacylase [Aquimarina sp. AD10]RKM95125.1 NAD-dependent deacylase [Aquimarina sp. AD10]